MTPEEEARIHELPRLIAQENVQLIEWRLSPPMVQPRSSRSVM
jgi:hypothetical protein